MRGMLFSDLVVSRRGPGAARWAGPMPVSMMLHGGALAALVLVPLLKNTDLPRAPVVEPPLTFPTLRPPVVRVDGGSPVVRPRPAQPTAPRPGPRFVEPPVVTAVLPEPSDLGSEVLAIGDDTPPCVGCADVGLPPGPGGGSDIGAPPGAATGTPGPVRVGQGVVEPRKLRHVDPAYPDLARVAGIGATLILECRIDPEGHVADIQVLRGHPLFDAAAVNAVRQWTYRPSLLNGQPVSVLMAVTVRFIAKR